MRSESAAFLTEHGRDPVFGIITAHGNAGAVLHSLRHFTIAANSIYRRSIGKRDIFAVFSAGNSKSFSVAVDCPSAVGAEFQTSGKRIVHRTVRAFRRCAEIAAVKLYACDTADIGICGIRRRDYALVVHKAHIICDEH